MSITPETLKILRAPYTAAAVKWRADAKTPDKGGRVRCLAYIDSSLARERLSEVDADWIADYRLLGATQGDLIGASAYVPVECTLTLCGITRKGVGQANGAKHSSSLVKAAYSDALKRAALEFGVGAYLRALKTFHVQGDGTFWTKGGGDVGGLNPSGITQLRNEYAKLIKHKMFTDRFGEAIDYGDLEDDDRSATPEDVSEAGQQSLGVVPAPLKRARGVRS